MTARGFALVTVLWVALIVGLIAASLATVARSTGQSAQQAEAALALRAALDRSLETAIWDIMTQRGQTGPPKGARADAVLRQNDDAIIRVIPATGLVDIQAAHPDVLRALVAGAGGNAALAEALLAARGRAALDMATLLTDIEMPAETRSALIAGSTLFAGQTAPDPARAPAEILRLFPGLEDAAIDAALAARKTAAELRPPAGYTAAQSWIPANGAVLPRGPVYHIRIAVASAAGVHGRESVVFIPLPEGRNVAPWFLLSSRALEPEAAEIRAGIRTEIRTKNRDASGAAERK